MHEGLDAPGPAHRVGQPLVGGAVLLRDADAVRDAQFAGVQRRVPRRLFFLAVQTQLHVQQLLAAATKHRQRAVRRNRVDGFGIIEVVGIFLRRCFLALDHFRFDHAVILQVFAQALQQRRILGEALHQYLARAVQRRLRVRHAGIAVAQLVGERLFQILGRFLFRVQRRIFQQRIGQRLQPRLQGDLRLGAALGLVGQIQVFELGLVLGMHHHVQQLRRHLALLGDGSDDGRAAVFQFAQVAQTVFQHAQLDVVQTAGRLLAVTRDERHGRALVQHLDGGGDLRWFGRNLGGESLFYRWQHGDVPDLSWASRRKRNA